MDHLEAGGGDGHMLCTCPECDCDDADWCADPDNYGCDCKGECCTTAGGPRHGIEERDLVEACAPRLRWP